MKKKKKWIKWVILLVIVGLVAAWLVFAGRQAQSVAYTELPVTTGDLATYYNFDGLVHANLSQSITAAEPGTVKNVYVVQNQQVRKGDRLYRMDSGETVKSDMDGEVTGLYIQEGSVVTSGQTTAQIIDMNRLEVRLNVDEYDVAAIVPGSEVEVSVLALDKVFPGSVISLDKNGTASGDLSYYTASVELAQSEGAYPGMQVSAKALRSHAENATLVRMDAVNFDEYNKPYVIMRSSDGKSTVNVPVSVGVSDGVYCEILDGVRAGETILRQNTMTMAELMQLMQSAR